MKRILNILLLMVCFPGMAQERIWEGTACHSRQVTMTAYLPYAAYVLRYRAAGKIEFVMKYRSLFRGNRHPDMICDLQRAIQLVRERYSGPVGAMGFSAGGHLVMSAGEYFDTNFLTRYGIEPSVSLRPDFVASIYPVVTLSAPPVHKRSRLGLLGEWTAMNPSMRDSLSLEHHVKADTPLRTCRICIRSMKPAAMASAPILPSRTRIPKNGNNHLLNG